MGSIPVQVVTPLETIESWDPETQLLAVSCQYIGFHSTTSTFLRTCEETPPIPGHFWYSLVIDVLEHHGMSEIGLSLQVMHACETYFQNLCWPCHACWYAGQPQEQSRHFCCRDHVQEVQVVGGVARIISGRRPSFKVILRSEYVHGP